MKKYVDEEWETIEKSTINTNYTSKQLFKFLIPSLLGVLLFLVPINRDGKWTIIYGVIANGAEAALEQYLGPFVILLFLISAVIAVITKLFKPAYVLSNEALREFFDITVSGIFIRIAALIFSILVYFKLGPETIWSSDTGGTAMHLVEMLLPWFFFAGLLIPLLLDFGIMEFVGVMVRDIMKPLFTLPGRSTLDCMASWIGSGVVGVVITTTQYDEGYYTEREASVVATCFSIVSMSFCLVIINAVDLGHMFIQMYSTVCVSCLAAAIICPRIPPLSKKPDTYYEPVGNQIKEIVPKGISKFQWGLDMAIKKADTNKSAADVVKKGLRNVFDIWLALMPIVMTIATVALFITEYTPIFKVLSMPIVPVLELLKIPEATAAAPAFIVGFIDLFLPLIIGQGITSELTRFIIACISVTQLIYMTETGPIILKSNIRLSFIEMLVIFIQRTVITVPIILLMARLLFF